TTRGTWHAALHTGTCARSRTPTVRPVAPERENTPYGRLCGPKGSPSGRSKGGIGYCLSFLHSLVLAMSWSPDTGRMSRGCGEPGHTLRLPWRKRHGGRAGGAFRPAAN